MSAYTESPRYRRCQAIFDRTYPNFRDASKRYADQIAQVIEHDSQLLDVGCGRTSLAVDVLRQAERRIGIDLSLSDLVHNSSMQAVALADAVQLPFADATFDVLVSQWVVEHFVDPQAAFAELGRVLRPGGRLVLLTTNARHYIPVISRLLPDGVQRFLIERLLRRPTHESFPTMYRANTGRALERLAGQTGFRVEALEFVGNPFYLAFNVLAFRAAMLYERLTDAPGLQGFKLYMVATLRRV